MHAYIRHAGMHAAACGAAGNLSAPGSLDTRANLELLVRQLRSDDLPTFERPMTANSGLRSRGQSATAALLVTNTEDTTLVF